jgi:hypothetical protein
MKSILYLGLLTVLLSANYCSNSISSNKKVVWENCYSCHTPGIRDKNISQADIAKKYGEKGLRGYLKSEFSKSSRSKVLEHRNIVLSGREKEKIVRFIVKGEAK